MFAGAGRGFESSHPCAPVEALCAAVDGVGEAWTRALPPFGEVDGGPSVLADQMSDPGLLAVVEAVGALTRRVEALGAVLAAEVARRSPVGSGTRSLARSAGHASPGRLVAASRGTRVTRAVELITVGEGTGSRRALSGEALPAVHPHVAAALHDGSISVDAAHLIITMLDRVAPRADAVELDATEAVLARQAAEFPFHQLVKLVGHAESRLDPGGIEPRQDVQHAARSLTLRQDPATGMLHLTGRFDPVTGAPIKTAFEAFVAARQRESRGHNHPGEADSHPSNDAAGHSGPAPAETRSTPQLQADALADFARHILACDTTVPLVPAVTMVVRIDLADLEDRDGGRGFATIDGVDKPISAGTARRLAASAGLIPAVFGGPSLPLDLGRRTRTFTRAQLLALAERDGGCAFCGQTTFVEAHHIRWWHRDHGRTDLTNAVLLCSRCHHTIHREGWGIHVDPETAAVRFTPPQDVDPDQRAREAIPNPRTLLRRPPDVNTRPPGRDNQRDRPPAGPGQGRREQRTPPIPRPATLDAPDTGPPLQRRE